MRTLIAAAVCLLAFPGIGHAASATIVSRDEPIAGARSLASVRPAQRFNLVGLHWQGSGVVGFRTRSLGGRWSAWRAAAPEAEDLPDRTAAEQSRPGWRIGNPQWTGPANAIQYRRSGKVTRLRAWFVWSPPDATPMRSLALAGAPPIIPRLSWGANEQIRRGSPLYSPTLELAIVHHTAGSNDYTRAESAAIVRAIQLYHVRGNGWNDIGYNFLVDKYGQVFEGRFGGVERNVVGAHAQGFNTGSFGAAVLGDYTGRRPSAAAQNSLAALIAWRLDLVHVDPLRTFSAISRGNPRFPAGIPVFLRTISGHRDTGFTDCPGDAFYARLNDLAGAVAETGLPKLYTPSARGGPGGLVRFTARLSGAVPWTVTVTDAAGVVVASGMGTGPTLDWTWDATTAAAGTYAYSIGGPSIRPATGTLGRAAVFGITQLRAEPAVVSPNADGVDDATTVSYTLGTAATVTATLLDQTGAVVTTLFSEPKAAGPQSFVFTAEGVPDGTYQIVLTAVNAGGRQATATVSVLVSRVLSAASADRKVFSPNGDGRADELHFAFTLAEPAEVRLRILRGGKWVATPFAGSLDPGAQSLPWDGRKRLGRLLDGDYEAELTATTANGSVTQRVPFASDITRPVLRLLALRPLRLEVSEPASVVLTLDGVRRVVERRTAGRFTVGLRKAPKRVRGVAWDRAGNTGLLVRAR
jgi:hypothetical protein